MIKNIHIVSSALVLALVCTQGMQAFSIVKKSITTNVNCYSNINMPTTGATGSTVQVILGDCNIDIRSSIGKAGEIVRKSPSRTIDLGQGIIDKAGLPFPAQGSSLALKFRPTAGQLAGASVNFLIENIAPDKIAKELAERNLLKLDIVKKAQIANKPLALLVFSRNIGGQLKWLDLGQTILLADDLNTTFSAKVDASGKLITSASGDYDNDGILYDLSKLNLTATPR